VSDLIPRIIYGDLDLTGYPYSVVFDYDLGVGELAYESLVSQLLDGDLVTATRTSNRELTIPVVVDGATLFEVAENTAALARECDKRSNLFSVVPGDDFGAPSVFDTFQAQLRPRRNDTHETNGLRVFDLVIPAHPFPRSYDPTTLPAIAGTGSVIDDCTSLTGWSAETGSIAISSGAVVNTRDREDWGALSRAGSIDLTSTPYLVIEWSCSVPMYIDAKANSAAAGWRESYREDLGGSTRSYFNVGGPIDSAGFRVGSVQGQTPGSMTFSIHTVSSAATLPDSGTGGHQQLLSIAPGGSARTQAQIEVTTPTNGLGEVTLYTSPSGRAYTPTIRRWLVSSDTVVTNPAGSYQPIVGASVYQVPVLTLPPGGYSVWARMAATTTVDVPINWNAGTWINGTAVGDSQGDLVTCSFTANIWKMYPLGLVTLPPAKVGVDGTVRVGIQRGSGSATVYLYDVFLFHESGDLTVVQCGLGTSSAGGSSRRFRVLPPSTDNPGGLLEKGHATDWTDSFAAGSSASARPARGHVLHPEGTSVFLFTEGTPDGSPASVTASWFKRWHTHAVD